MEDVREVSLLGVHGRDAGKQFFLQEIEPRTMAGFVLRLVAALRVASYESVIEQVRGQGEDAPVPIDVVMGILQGADPTAVHGLMNELLDSAVRISPDPRHPGVKRPLMSDDIRELRTLGDILMALGRMHFDLPD